MKSWHKYKDQIINYTPFSSLSENWSRETNVMKYCSRNKKITFANPALIAVARQVEVEQLFKWTKQWTVYQMLTPGIEIVEG